MRTYGNLSRQGDCWVIDRIEPHVVIRLKQLFPRIPKWQTAPFTFPADVAHAADLIWFMGRYPLVMSETDMAGLQAGRAAFDEQQGELGRIMLSEYAPPAYVGLKPGSEVRHYQAQAVEVLARSRGLLLGDEVGLGKTFTAAAACLKPGALPAVIVCQTHLQAQWVKVLHSFTSLRAHAIKKTKPYDLPPADVYVMRYSQLLGWVDMFPTLGAKLVVYDEVQELRTGTSSGKGNAASVLSLHADMKLGLTATPIYNYGAEIWSIMQFIRPDVLGSFDDFAREWCVSLGNGKWKINDPQALGSFLREQYAFLRRTKKDVGQEMPAVNRIVDTVEYDAGIVQSAEALAHKLAIRATTGAFTERGQAARDLDIMMRKATGLAKASQVADFARIVVEGGEPIVLVGWHRDVYDVWLQRLADLKPAMYTGSESAAGKDREKERFLSGETDILIMSLRSGAGLDGLQFRCSTMIFGELDWSPGVHHQCIGRLDREGQASPVTAIFLVADEGSDPPMMEVIGLKASEASQIIDPGLGVQAQHSDTSHLKTLVERYLNKGARRSAPPAAAGVTASNDCPLFENASNSAAITDQTHIMSSDVMGME